jgi:hypothetical protein
MRLKERLQREKEKFNTKARLRRLRRTAGWLARYLSDALLEWAVEADGRDPKGQSWKDARVLFKAILVGLLAGCKGLRELEELTAQMSEPMRALLGIPGRIPDTTMRDFLTKVDPIKLQQVLSVVGYDAYRRKALRCRDELGIAFGVLSMDGKYPSISDTNPSTYLQVHHQDGEATHGLVRSITSCLITAVGRPVLGATPIPGDTNEVGWFKQAFGDMVRIYGRLFRVVMYDAGGASQSNGDAVIKARKDYIFLLADERWQMLQHVKQLLEGKAPAALDEQIVSETKRIVRKVTLMRVQPTRKNIILWEHIRTIIRIETETYENGALESTEARYAVSSLDVDELTAAQWLRLLVCRWDVESAHGILDTAFAEDERPWIRKDARGNLAVHLLRRVAYTLTALYKHVTVRNEDESLEPWRRYLEWVKEAVKWTPEEAATNFRPRKFAAPPALG